MKQEDKELLRKDLCTRLPYNVWVEYKGKYYIVTGIAHERLVLLPNRFSSIGYNESPLVEEVKLCLFPLSSMTKEQREYYEQFTFESASHFGFVSEAEELIAWLNKNHFDYRGLIPMGLAIDATGLNIY